LEAVEKIEQAYASAALKLFLRCFDIAIVRLRVSVMKRGTSNNHNH
jgi:hypothetical protein